MHDVTRLISQHDPVDEVILRGFPSPSVVVAGCCTHTLCVSTICQNVPSQLPSVAAAVESPDSRFEHLLALPERDTEDFQREQPKCPPGHKQQVLLKIIKGCDWLGAGGDVTAPLLNCSCASAAAWG